MSRYRIATCGLLLAIRLLFSTAAAQAVSITDVEPSSSDTDQNSEPSVAVNPANPQQILLTAFSDTTSPVYYTPDGGTTWTDVQGIDSSDSTMDWANGGNAYFSNINGAGDTIQVWRWNAQNTVFDLIPGASLTLGGDGPDQPRLAAVHAAGQDHLFIGFNDLSQATNTASIYYSLDSGTTWNEQEVERVTPGAGQDGFSIRPAVSGSTVYLCFERWNKFLSNGNFTGDVVVVKDNDNGADEFQDLGTGAIADAGVEFPEENIGSERAGSDLGTAVSPLDAKTIYIAYCVQVNGVAVARVMMSADGGVHWSQIYQTTLHSALPDLAVGGNGAVGLLYEAYEDGDLETRFVQSGDNFVTHREEILARFKNGSPKVQYQPYVGDFQIVKAVGNQFYGTFCASNDVSLFPLPVNFVRDTSVLGKSVAFSIDAFEFNTPALAGSYQNVAPVTPAQVFTFSGHGPVTFNVISGASDANGDSLTLTAVGKPMHGRVTSSVNGDVTYTPSSSFAGEDSFTYTISDGNGGVSTGTVTIETPFYPVAGIYNGLAVNDPQTNEGTGIFQASVNYHGSYSGKLVLGGTSYSFSGALGGSGTASAVGMSSRRQKVTIVFDVISGGELTGTASEGSVVATFAAQADPYNSSNPAPETGKVFTFAIPHDAANTSGTFPQGDGFGTATVTSSGAVHISGALGDGTAFTQAAYLSGSNAWPLYVALYGKAGSISGDVTFSGTMPVLSGSLQWYRPANARSAIFPDGFAMSVELTGAPYVVAKGTAVLSATTVRVRRGDGTMILHHMLTSSNNVVTITDPGADKLKLKISAQSGTITGSFLDTVSGKTLSIHARIVQPNAAYGYFRDGDQFGRIELSQ